MHQTPSQKQWHVATREMPGGMQTVCKSEIQPCPYQEDRLSSFVQRGPDQANVEDAVAATGLVVQLSVSNSSLLLTCRKTPRKNTGPTPSSPWCAHSQQGDTAWNAQKEKFKIESPHKWMAQLFSTSVFSPQPLLQRTTTSSSPQLLRYLYLSEAAHKLLRWR